MHLFALLINLSMLSLSYCGSKLESLQSARGSIPFQNLHDQGDAGLSQPRKLAHPERLSSLEADKRRKQLENRERDVQRLRQGERVGPIQPISFKRQQHHRRPLPSRPPMPTRPGDRTMPEQPPNHGKFYDPGYNVDKEVREVRDATLADAGRGLSVNCSNIHELSFQAHQYAAGTTVLAHTGTFRGKSVIIKRPRQKTPSGHDISHEVAEERFRQEAYMLVHFRHAHHVKYLGGCFERGKLTNVMQKLRSWGGLLKRSDFTWQRRLCASLRLARLVDFWSKTPQGAHVHCDFFTHQFAFDEDFVPYMIDIDGLQPVPIGSNSRCEPDGPDANDSVVLRSQKKTDPLQPSSACRGKCWKSNLWPSRFGVADETLDELMCNTETGRCVGFDTSYNVYSFAQTLVQDLFMKQNVDHSGIPKIVVEGIKKIVRGATMPKLADRWSIEKVIDQLTKLVIDQTDDECKSN